MTIEKEKKRAPDRCSKCSWIHEADSTAGTSFKGVGLCQLHAAAPDALALARNITSCVDNGKRWEDCDSADLLECLEAFESQARAVIAKAKP